MTNPKDLPGVKQSEIKKCANCGKGVMHANGMCFYIVDIRYMIVDPGSIQRQHGMEMMMGKAAGLAAVMGRDEDMAKQLDKHSGWICMKCAMETPLAFLSETIAKKKALGDD